VQLLRYDKRQNGAHGRALGGHVNELGLKIGDRLEPGLDLQDISGIDKHAVFPLRLVFWRCSMETSTRHRNPLFMRQYGLDPAESLTVDNLHANNLGIMNVYAKTAVWHILGSSIFYGRLGTATEQAFNALLGFRHSLFLFYKSWDAAHPHGKLTRLSDLTIKMIGTHDSPLLKTKGAETFGILMFVIHILTLHKARVGDIGAKLLRAGQALARVVEIMSENAWVMPDIAIKEGVGGTAIDCDVDRLIYAYIYT
jgi:hypothetical protein